MLRHLARNQKWFIAEMTLVAMFLLVSGSVGVDRLIVSKAPPTVNGEVDYVYLARLSSDAYEGWLAAYGYAKQAVQEVENKKVYTKEDLRKITYASSVISNIRISMRYLAARYGDYQDIADFGINKSNMPFDKKEVNPAERQAFERLESSIPTKELIELEEKVTALHTTVLDQVGPIELDRSFQSPLIK